jgi:hypothetical protein
MAEMSSALAKNNTNSSIIECYMLAVCSDANKDALVEKLEVC